MNLFIRSITLVLGFLVAAGASAVTLKYDLVGLSSHNNSSYYPDLNFSNAKSALLTVNKTSFDTEPELVSLVLTFPQVAKLTATEFKKMNGGFYRAVVSNAWIYRQVVVDVYTGDLNVINQGHIWMEVSVSEKYAFIQPQEDIKGESIFYAYGNVRDITATKVVDVESRTVNGKKLTLSLKDRLGVAPQDAVINGNREGFVVDALWMGKGQKTLYIPSFVSMHEYDYITAIGLVIEESATPMGVEYLVSVKFKDQQGTELTSPPTPLTQLLDSVYPPQF